MAETLIDTISISRMESFGWIDWFTGCGTAVRGSREFTVMLRCAVDLQCIECIGELVKPIMGLHLRQIGLIRPRCPSSNSRNCGQFSSPMPGKVR